MPMRLSGLMSGMDTETIISQLVEARSTKVESAKKAQTKLQWKQDAWKELNTKLKNLHSKYISKMRFSDAYSKKTTKVSNGSAVSVITGESAMNGVQSLTVDQLAKTAYMTGGNVAKEYVRDENGNVVTDENGDPTYKDITALTKLKDMAGMESLAEGTTLTFQTSGEPVTLEINENTTISDVLTEMKKAGLNANFDAKQQRFFISAKESGADQNFSITGDADTLKALGLNVKDKSSKENGAIYIEGQNAQITLNDTVFESKDNVFEINGLTFTALSETNGETVTVTTQQDTDGIYDMIKGFLKEYNTIINEIDKLYNADSAKGYEPLSDDEKDVMSESEIEKYEQKIKDALLRRDSSLSTVGSTLKEAMMKSFAIDGKTFSLSSFGIETLSYFVAPENEKNAYHLAGDPDDSETSGNPDKLKSMIASDPDTVISFFTKLSNNLYTELNNISKSVEGYRSFGNFYDDKKMKSDYDDYTSKIKELEEKLADYEDKWYSKFSKMETAMAKMQSNASAITGMLGGQ